MRIHFTSSDMGRVQLKPGMHLGWEIVNSVRMLRTHGSGLWLRTWRTRMRERVRQDTAFRAALQALTAHGPRAETIAGRGESGELGAAVRVYYRTAIHPELPEINDALRFDSTNRLHLYSHEGAEALLASLGPAAAWDHPVLTFDHPVDGDLHLDGRGLLLIPSYFSPGRPILSASPPRPTLVFPLEPVNRLLREESGRGDHLGALLGPTRAAILRAVLAGSTNTDLARRTGVSPATVSHHTTVLRAAGLIITRRTGNTATHLITPLGLHVLGVSG